MPTIRYVQRPSAASSAHLRPEPVFSGGGTGTNVAGARPDNNSHSSSFLAAAAAEAADDSSSNNNGLGNAHASIHDRLPSAGAGRFSAPPPPPPDVHVGQMPQAQPQLQQKAVVTPNQSTAASRFDTPDAADQFADADEEDGKEEGNKVDNDTLLASASRQNQSRYSYETCSSVGLGLDNNYSTTKPAAADNSTTTASALAHKMPPAYMPPLEHDACVTQPAEPGTTAPNTTAPHAHKMHAGQFDDFDDELPSAANGGTDTSTNINTSNGKEPPQMDAGLDTHRQPQQTEQETEVPEKQEAAKEGHANSGGDAVGADAHADADAEADTTDTAVGDDDDLNTTAATEVEAAAEVAAGADAGASSSDAAPEEFDATELPPAFKIELGKAIVRLQRQIKEDVLDKTHLRSIGCILGKRHKIMAPNLFKETLELPEVKDSDAATEDVKERIAKLEAVVETKNVIEGIGPHDVLFGRGGRTNLHEGNVYYRNLLQKYKLDYINASKNTKPHLSREIVYIWRNLEPPGRFLRIQEVRSGYNPDDPDNSLPDVEVWEDVGHNRAQQKTSQCLRERNAQLRAAEGITALFRVGEAEKREAQAREDEIQQAEQRRQYAAHRVASIAAQRARAAAAMQPYAYGMTPMPATMGGYYPLYQELPPLLKRRITADGTTPPSTVPGALSLVTPTTASPLSAYQKRPRLGYPETLAPGTAVPAAPLWQQASLAAPVPAPVATAPAVGMAPYESTDVSAQVAAEVQQIASLKEKIKAAQDRIETAHQRIGTSNPDNSPGLSSAPAVANPAIPPAPPMLRTQPVIPAPVLPAVPVAPPAPTIPTAPVQASHPVAAAPGVTTTAIPPPAYTAAAGQFPPVPQPQPAYHLPEYPAEGLTAASRPAVAPNPAAYPAGLTGQPPQLAAARPAGGGAAYPPPPPPHATTYTWFAGAKTTVPSDMSPS